MDGLYWACVGIAGTALVLISAIIPWAVFTRYVLNRAASWPEATAVLLTIVLTFIGAASCYRLRLHMNIGYFVSLMPLSVQRILNIVVELIMGAMALFMTAYGAKLVAATWYNVVSDFPFLSVGITYLPIPIGGFALFLFVVERLTIGAPPMAATATAH